VTHHYEANELGNYDNVIDLKGYMEGWEKCWY
jgi:hypothetical protein